MTKHQDLNLTKIREDGWLPSSYPFALLLDEPEDVPVEFVIDGTPEQIAEIERAHAGEREVWLDPDLSPDSKFLFCLLNTFRHTGEAVPKPAWFITLFHFTGVSLTASINELRAANLLRAGEFECL